MAMAQTATFEAGFARTEITPKLGIRLGGYGMQERPVESVHDALHANALALRQGDQAALLLSLDLLGLEEVDTTAMRCAISTATGVPVESITIACTHTHTSPCTYAVFGWGDKEVGYLADVFGAIVAAGVQAWGKLAPAQLGIGTCQTQVGVNRRRILANHQTSLCAEPCGSFDPTLTLLRFTTASGPLVNLVHLGCHPTAWGAPRLASRDWPGVMIDRMETQTGTPAVFFNGCIGDVGPRTSKWLPQHNAFSAGTGNDWESVLEIGLRAAGDALHTWAAIKEFRHELPLALASADQALPYRPLASREEAERQLALAAPRKDSWGAGMCDYRHWASVLEALQGQPRTGYPYRQTITRLGPLAFVPVPGEIFSGIGLRLRALSPLPHTLMLSQANGSIGYLPTREAQHRGGYEVWVARAFGPYLPGETVDDYLVEHNLALLQRLTGA